MLYASDIASLHGAYLNKLHDLVRIFHRPNILVVEGTEITGKNELIDFLKAYGFKYIEMDFKSR